MTVSGRPALHTSTTAPRALIRSAERADIVEPLNIGSDELVTINRLVDIAEEIAGVKLKRSYKLDAFAAFRLNSDNTLIEKP